MSESIWSAVDGFQGDSMAEGVRRMLDLVAQEPRVTATAVQTVGSKGWDGFCPIRVER